MATKEQLASQKNLKYFFEHGLNRLIGLFFE